MEGFNAEGNSLGKAVTNSDGENTHTLQIEAVGITTLVFTGGGNEGLLIQLCIYGKPDDVVVGKFEVIEKPQVIPTVEPGAIINSSRRRK